MNTDRQLRHQRQPYGCRWQKNHPIAYEMWRARFNEPEPLPEFGMHYPLVDDGHSVQRAVCGREVWRLASTTLRPRHFEMLCLRYIEGLTLDEIGANYGCTKERVRQLEQKALRILRDILT